MIGSRTPIVFFVFHFMLNQAIMPVGGQVIGLTGSLMNGFDKQEQELFAVVDLKRFHRHTA